MTETRTPETTALEDAQVFDAAAVVDLMAALERVFRIGVYYPSGHAMCDKAADDFLVALERTLGKAPSLRFTVSRGILHLQDAPLDEELRGVTGFREILTQLGINCVVIDSNVAAGEMLQFVRQLLAYRSRIKGVNHFQHLEIEDLPLSISVEHLEFTAHDVDEEEEEEIEEAAGGDVRNPTLEALLTSLARQGMGARELQRCRELFEAIPAYLRDNQLDGVALPQVNWQDVQTLLLRATQPSEIPADGERTGQNPSHVNLDALTAIFRELAARADTENPREAIDLLLNLSRRDIPAAFRGGDPEARPQPRRCPEIETWPLQDLRTALEACTVRAEGRPDFKSDGSAEELAIVLQMLGNEHKLPVQVRISKRIRDIARGGLRGQEWRVAVAGMRDLAEPNQEEGLSGPLIILTDSMRAGGAASVLAFLRDLAAACDPERRIVVWPFLVNEILLEGRTRDAQVFADACRLAGEPDEAAMQTQLPRLESLGALRERRCVRGTFTPPPPELHAMFAVVLGSAHGDAVGASFLEGMRQEPPNWLAQAVVPLIPRYEPRHRHFLVEALRLQDGQEASKPLLESAGRIVGEYLPDLSAKQGREPWLPQSLRAFAALNVPGGEAVLQDVVDRRRWFFFPAWPEACRQAARDTLASWAQRDGRPAEPASRQRRKETP